MGEGQIERDSRGGSRICGKGGGRSGYRECRRREGFWRVPFEDPLWNFKRGARAPCAPPLNPLVDRDRQSRDKSYVQHKSCVRSSINLNSYALNIVNHYEFNQICVLFLLSSLKHHSSLHIQTISSITDIEDADFILSMFLLHIIYMYINIGC